MRATVLDDYQGVVPRLKATKELDGVSVILHTLTERIADEDALIEVLRDTDYLVLIRERTQITARIVEALPRLKLVVQTGRLSGCIDLDACRKRGVEVRAGTGNSIAPTELTWALILGASRRLVPYAERLSLGIWQRTRSHLTDEGLGRTLHGRTLGVWSLGKIGSRVAAIGHAFGMRVVVHGRDQSREAAVNAGYEFIAERRQFLAQLDVLTLHLRFSAETRHLIGVEDLVTMRPDALLVNTSRAEFLAPGALLAALARGRPGMAALDVFEEEPDGAAPYLNHPAILCTPHLGFVEQETYEAYFGEAFAHVRRFAESLQSGSGATG